MQSLEEKKNQFNVIIKTCYITDIIYLASRIVYFVIFLLAQAWVMFYANIASIIIYLLGFLVIKKKKYYLYVLICGNEFLVLMSLGTLFLGFEAGFHLCIIGICIVSYFTAYFSVKRKIHNAIIWTVQSTVIYLTLHFICSFNEPFSPVAGWVNVTLFTLHSIAVFSFILSYLMIFIKYALDLEGKIKNESRTDELTQLSNRYDLCNYVDLLEKKNDYALAIFDIDDFKVLNDTYGHIFGDYVLKGIAHIAIANAEGSFVSRYGGEEFVLIIKLYGDENKAYKIMDKIRKSVESNEFTYQNAASHTTISAGIAKYNDGMNLDEWINLADEKLYKAKNDGKNKVIM